MKASISEKKYQKWVKEYIDGVDLENIEWLSLDYKGLMSFYQDNYIDEEYESFVAWRNGNIALPFGMYYLSFNKEKVSDKYLLGVVKNKKGTKTIVSALIYNNSVLFADQKTPVTYIQTMETNSFFKGRGLFKCLASKLINVIDNNQNIIITPESIEGSIVRTIALTKEILMEQGFTKDIRCETEIDDDYIESLRISKRK